MEAGSKNKQGVLLLFLYLLVLGVIVYFFIDAFAYYLSPLSERAHHPAYRDLRPASLRSHSFAVIGSTMLLFLLSYSLRKRMTVLQNRGSLRSWLNVHIFLGTSGPLFIILHSTFKLNGLVAVSFWSMVIVAVSGIIGRYLYVQIPRSQDGHALTLEEINNEYTRLVQQMTIRFDLDGEAMTQLNSLQLFSFSREDSNFSAFIKTSLAALWNPLRYYRYKRLIVSSLAISKKNIKPLIRIIHKKTIIERRLHFLHLLQSLFHYWHVFHKPFAFVMYIIMFIHIGIAVWLGYKWVF
jgi:hypothetical protein